MQETDGHKSVIDHHESVKMDHKDVNGAAAIDREQLKEMVSEIDRENAEYEPKKHPLDVGEDLPRLNARMSKFLHGLLDGMTADAAYRAAYPNAGPSTVNTNATRLRHHPKIAKWLKFGRIAGMATAGMTLATHLQDLMRIRELAIENGDMRSAVAAEHLRGKASGFYVDRVEVTNNDPAALLQQIAAISPETAQALARRFNRELPSQVSRAIADRAGPELAGVLIGSSPE